MRQGQRKVRRFGLFSFSGCLFLLSCLFLCLFHRLLLTLMLSFLSVSSLLHSSSVVSCVPLSFFPPFKWQILYSLLFNVHSVSFSLWPVWRHIAELGDARLKATQARQERGVRGRIVFSWEPLWLVCGQLTYAGQPFKLMCFFFFIHVWLLPWGVIRLCQQYDIQPCATFITSTGRAVLLSLWLVQDEWTE